MDALLRLIRAAWNTICGTTRRLERVDRDELMRVQRQYERTAREEQFPFG